VGIDIRNAARAATVSALGAAAGLVITAPSALADPVQPVGPPPPPAAQDAAPEALAADSATPPNGVPHLSSPQNLPPGTTEDRPPQSRGLTYLRELWQAVQTQNISGKDALLLLTQRPLDPNSAPPPGLSAGPQAQGPAQPPPPTP
jgi:hypothetical protein